MPNELIESMVSNLKNALSQLASGFTRLEAWAVVLIATAAAAFIAILIIYGVRASRHTPLSGRQDFVAKTAIAKTVLNPQGTVLIDGELWSATLEQGEVQPGEEVVITKTDNLRLRVIKK
jgi:membrane-bound ClpP family serine protease